MARSAVVIDPDYLKHDPGQFHPERPERLKVLLDLPKELDATSFQLLPPRSALREEIEPCHSSDYIELVQSTSEKNRYALDGDTITCRDSFGTGLLAAGGFLQLIDSIEAGNFRNGFALVRPPGHHALRDRAMATMLLDLAAKHAGGKIAFLLEGGYDLKALRNSVIAVLQRMKGDSEGELPAYTGGEMIQPLIRKVLNFQEKYW